MTVPTPPSQLLSPVPAPSPVNTSSQTYMVVSPPQQPRIHSLQPASPPPTQSSACRPWTSEEPSPPFHLTLRSTPRSWYPPPPQFLPRTQAPASIHSNEQPPRTCRLHSRPTHWCANTCALACLMSISNFKCPKHSSQVHRRCQTGSQLTSCNTVPANWVRGSRLSFSPTCPPAAVLLGHQASTTPAPPAPVGPR